MFIKSNLTVFGNE